jgi:hypothetical protein
VIEDSPDTVARALDDLPPMANDHPAQDRIVAREGNGHCLLVLLPEPDAAFDVGQKEGDRTR